MSGNTQVIARANIIRRREALTLHALEGAWGQETKRDILNSYLEAMNRIKEDEAMILIILTKETRLRKEQGRDNVWRAGASMDYLV